MGLFSSDVLAVLHLGQHTLLLRCYIYIYFFFLLFCWKKKKLNQHSGKIQINYIIIIIIIKSSNLANNLLT